MNIKAQDNIRVLHCPTMVGGNPQELARAERELGLKSWSVVFGQTSAAFKTDEILFPHGNGLLNQVTREFKRWHLLWRALRHFDLVHFNFGHSIMPAWIDAGKTVERTDHTLLRWIYQKYANLFELRDLAWLKRAGKGIVVTYQGDDARQGDYCLDNFEINFASVVKPGYYSPESDSHKRWRIKKFAQYADRIYAVNPDLLHILPSQTRFMPYSHIDLKKWQVVDKPETSEVPIILHAPTHRDVKGTHFIINAVSRLQSEGVAIEFILVEGVSHAELQHISQQADLLIDQLLAGWYGGLAVELMALGKPVICYIREQDLKFIPLQMCKELPIINATPSNLYEVLKEWLTVRKYELPQLGRRSRAYVEKWHDPLKIAAQLKKEYEHILASKQQKTRIEN